MTHYDKPPERLSRLRPGDSVSMPVRATDKLLITSTPCCKREVRATKEEIDYARKVFVGRHLAYVLRPCPGCRWPYRVDFEEDNSGARLVLRIPR